MFPFLVEMHILIVSSSGGGLFQIKRLPYYNSGVKQVCLSKKMRHRHVSNSFTRSGTDQHGNNHTPTEQSYFPTGRGAGLENGPFIGPMNPMARGGVPEGRPNETSSNISMEIQPYVPAPPADLYSHSSISESRSLAPVPAVGHIHGTNYNVPSMRDMEIGLSNHPLGNGGSLKRKRSDSFYSAGSSSSSQMPIEKTSMVCQSGPPYRGSLTIGGDDSSRNVRRRHRLELEPRTHAPHHSSHYYHPSNYSSAPVQHANLDANGGHWNCVPPYAPSSHRRISPSEINGSRHEMNQFHIGGSSADGGSLFNGHHPVSSSQSLHGPHLPSREEHTNHSRRAKSSYGHGPRYSHYAHGGSSSTNGLHTPTYNFSSRNSRHYSPGGWRSSYRSGRPRTAVDRFQPVFDTTEPRDRMGHETIMMVDRAPFYGSSRNFSDQYGDMRLDIDNMSYEELLNLEERIGNVSTGLSEDSMLKFTRVKFHSSSDQNQEESCPICLEEYTNEDKVGTMEKCGHEYHVDCIKKWLLMKKLCPICKTECSN